MIKEKLKLCFFEEEKHIEKIKKRHIRSRNLIKM